MSLQIIFLLLNFLHTKCDKTKSNIVKNTGIVYSRQKIKIDKTKTIMVLVKWAVGSGP